MIYHSLLSDNAKGTRINSDQTQKKQPKHNKSGFSQPVLYDFN